MHSFDINHAVRLINTGDNQLENQEGIIVGFHGNDFPIVKFNSIPQGYNPVICILYTCMENIST
jgi:hypothetical protein